MFGFIRNKYHWLFALQAPEWLKARPQDLSGPHPKRLKPFRFVFRLEGEEELAVDIPLPPYQHDHDLPSLDIFSRKTLGKWDRPGVERVLVVDEALANERIRELQNWKIHWSVDFPTGGWQGTEDERLQLRDSIRRESTVKLVDAELFFYAGIERFPWRFAEFKIGIRLEQDGDYLSRQMLLKQAEDENEKYAHLLWLPPVYPVGDVMALHGAWGMYFQSRPLGDDEKYVWSTDKKSRTNATERDYLVIPLSQRRALYMNFEMICASEPPRRWRPRVVQVIEAIISGMRFHGPWPHFDDEVSPASSTKPSSP